MEFLDVSQFKVVSMNRYSTFKIKVNGDEYLDLPISDSSKYIDKTLTCTFKAPSVLYSIVVSLDNPTLEDFEVICENWVTHIFDANCTDATRTDAERAQFLNKLPSNRWILRPAIRDRIHCPLMTLMRTTQFKWRNRNINIKIRTADDQFQFELIGAEEETN